MSSDDSSDDSPPPRAAAAATPGSGGGGHHHQTTPAEIVEATRAWSAVARSFLYVEVSSLVLMFSCIGVWKQLEGSSLLAYALSASVISLAACLGIQTWEFLKPGALGRYEKPVSLFLFVWWGIATGIVTFKGPFGSVSNGYFSAWAGLIFTSHWALHIDTSLYTDLPRGKKLLAGGVVASSVLLFACIPFLRAKIFVGQSAWGLTAAILTLLISGMLFKALDDINAQVVKGLAVFKFVVWATVAGVCTFDGPFLVAGNGYFASWGGFLLSTFFLQFVITREDEIV